MKTVKTISHSPGKGGYMLEPDHDSKWLPTTHSGRETVPANDEIQPFF